MEIVCVYSANSPIESTLFLTRKTTVEGQILWDGIDIREFNPQEFRRRIAAIFQDFVHFDLTAYENIALGSIIQFNDTNRVHQSAIKAGIHGVWYRKTLSGGLNSDISGLQKGNSEQHQHRHYDRCKRAKVP